MKKKILQLSTVGFLLMLIYSCSDQANIILDKNKKEQIPVPPEYDKSPSARVSSFQAYEQNYGALHTITVVEDFRNANNGGQLNSGFVDVPPDYVLIGGAAQCTNIDAGAFITECRPDWPNNRWVAESKSHIDTDDHTLRIYATGLKIDGVTPETLRSVMIVQPSTPSSSQGHPNNYAWLPSGYTVVGGGAKVNWSGWGNLLVQSNPSGQGWFVSSKDHIYSSPATIDAWVIGIQNYIPGYGNISVKIRSNTHYSNSGVSIARIGPTLIAFPDVFTLSIGAFENYNTSGYGRMLEGISPTFPSSTAQSKDHKRACSGTLYIYEIYIE